MPFEPWMLTAMEEEGYMDTSDGLINRVANYLQYSQNATIGAEEFRKACIACDVDPDSFTQRDLNQLQRMLNRK